MGRVTRTAGVALVAAAVMAGTAAGAPGPPPEIQPSLAHPRLVLSTTALGGRWQVWTGRAQGHDQVFVVRLDTTPRAIAGNQCDPPGRPLRVCLYGSIDRTLDVVLGRFTPRVAQLSGRTGSGALLRVDRGRGWFLGVARIQDPGRMLVARDERGAVIERTRVDAP